MQDHYGLEILRHFQQISIGTGNIVMNVKNRKFERL
jgi:hypothetical protein